MKYLLLLLLGCSTIALACSSSVVSVGDKTMVCTTCCTSSNNCITTCN